MQPQLTTDLVVPPRLRKGFATGVEGVRHIDVVRGERGPQHLVGLKEGLCRRVEVLRWKHRNGDPSPVEKALRFLSTEKKPIGYILRRSSTRQAPKKKLFKESKFWRSPLVSTQKKFELANPLPYSPESETKWKPRLNAAPKAA